MGLKLERSPRCHPHAIGPTLLAGKGLLGVLPRAPRRNRLQEDLMEGRRGVKA